MKRILALAAWLLLSSAALAQGYPNRPIRLIVPYPPGGTSDLTARVIAQRASQTLGQQIIIDNRGGAAGTIGAEIVARSAPDGYTLLLCDTTFAIVPGITKKLPYDPVKDFEPIVLGIKVPGLVVVNPKLPVRTLKDLLDYARRNPGKVAYGSGGVGTAVHLAGAFLGEVGKVDMIHVPYRGAGPAISDVVAGQLQMVIPSMPTVVPFVRSGQLRALALTAARRSDQLPDVPTVAEAGLPEYDATSWFGFSAPAGTPRAIVDRLNQEMNAALADPKVRATLHDQGAEIIGGTPDQFAGFIASEMKKWAAVAKASNVTADLK